MSFKKSSPGGFGVGCGIGPVGVQWAGPAGEDDLRYN